MTTPEAAGREIIFVDDYGRGPALVAKIRADSYAGQHGLSKITFTADGIDLPDRWGLTRGWQKAYDSLNLPYRTVGSLPHTIQITPERINAVEAIVCFYPEDYKYIRDLALRIPGGSNEDSPNKVFLLNDLAERIRLPKQSAEQVSPPKGRFRIIETLSSKWQSWKAWMHLKSEHEIKKEQILEIDQEVKTFVEHLSQAGRDWILPS